MSEILLRSEDGIVAKLSPLGARLVSLEMPDARGRSIEVLFGGPADYAGTICGRFANRIAGGSFTIDGRRYQLARNQGPNMLHGGPEGFDKRIWDAQQASGGVRFTLVSPDGDQGFPGELKASATYTLEGRVLACDIEARTNAPTMVNLTNHAYWNLAGGGDARGQELAIFANRYTEVDEQLIPVGGPISVAGTRFDFRQPRRIDQAYDNNFCLDGIRGELHPAAILKDPVSGRRMELSTTEPGVQLYTAQHFSAPLTRYGAIALEPQTWPDAPNHPEFPSALLRPGEVYRHRIEWRFGW